MREEVEVLALLLLRQPECPHQLRRRLLLRHDIVKVRLRQFHAQVVMEWHEQGHQLVVRGHNHRRVVIRDLQQACRQACLYLLSTAGLPISRQRLVVLFLFM